MLKRLLLACLAGLICLGSAVEAPAATVRQMLLDEVIDGAAVAFHGTCIANRVERDAATNLIVTYTTFAIDEAIKGKPRATHVIKQIGGTLPDGQSGLLVQGVPTFAVGSEYVVFLAGVSSLGFSSPVGLSQGNFMVQPGKVGKIVSTARSLRELTANMPDAASAAGLVDSREPSESMRQVGLEEFKRMARIHANRRQ